MNVLRSSIGVSHKGCRYMTHALILLIFTYVFMVSAWAEVSEFTVNEIDNKATTAQNKATDANNKAEGNNRRIQSLEIELSNLQQDMNDLKSIITVLKTQVEILSAFVVAGIQNSVVAIEGKIACVSENSSGTEFIFEGCNVNVRDGYGETSTTNSFGNLIIGYNFN